LPNWHEYSRISSLPDFRFSQVQLDQIEGIEEDGPVIALVADAIELDDAALVARLPPHR
jgi:hypothetical protein